MSERIAVVLMNTGGPDSKKAILPYLFNYYKDPQNLPLPFGLHSIGAFFTALVQRYTTARETYRRLGFQSPLLQNTKTQAISLERALNANKTGDVHYRCYVSMSYWHPFCDELFEEIKTYGADKVILLPMFPQKSFKTCYALTKDWLKTSQEEGYQEWSTYLVDSFYQEKGFIEAIATQISPSMYRISDKARRENLPKPRLVFIARYHQPRLQKKGDPYTEQVRATAESVIKAIGGDYEWRICYQTAPTFSSTVGPTIDEALKEAAKDKVPVMLIPLTHTVEDSVTMIHMDKFYSTRAERYGVPLYERVKTVGNHHDLMQALAEKILDQDRLIALDLDSKKLYKTIFESQK